MSDKHLPSSFEGNVNFYEESWFRIIFRRLKEEPLIPLGCAGTSYALYQATRSSKAGDALTTNRMFRYRIYGQAFTLVAILGGAYYYKADRLLRKEIYFANEEKKAKEKNEAWIKELEARNQENKEMKAQMEREKENNKRAMESQDFIDEQLGERSILDAVKKVEESAKASAQAAKNAVEARRGR